MDEALWTAVRSLQKQSVLLVMLAISHRNAGGVERAMKLDLARERIDRQRSELSSMVRHPLEP